MVSPAHKSGEDVWQCLQQATSQYSKGQSECLTHTEGNCGFINGEALQVKSCDNTP